MQNLVALIMNAANKHQQNKYKIGYFDLDKLAEMGLQIVIFTIK
jgi:hypothetical protein